MREPVLISLTLRWFGWLVALAIVLSEAAPRANLEDAPLVLAVTFVQLLVMSLYPKYIRPHFSTGMAEKAPVFWPILDGLFALWSIYQTGGWDSPFYHFAVTVVLAPSLRFGLLGALISSTLYSLAFMWVVKNTPAAFAPAYPGGQAEPGLVSIPLNPLMIGLYAAFLGEVLKKLHKEMERSQILAAENERARMARDIHDGVAQTLFMLSMSLETGQVLAQKEKAEKTLTHLRQLTPVAQKALLELRNTMHSTEPLEEGQQSLAEALTQLARDYRSATGLSIELEERAGFHCPAPLAPTIFRMVQEALSNACKHSQGSRITVTLEDALVSIRDNGIGFGTNSVQRGRGLSNLEKRAEDAKIQLSVESGESGSCVTFAWSEEAK